MKNSPTQILILDDHEVVAGGLKAVLASQFPEANIELARSINEAGLLKSIYEFDLYFLDITLQDGSGIDLLKKLNQEGVKGKKVIFTGSATTLELMTVQEVGADAIIAKTELTETILEAVEKVTDGQSYISPAVSKKVESSPAQIGLTPRMTDVLRLLNDGAGNKEIAFKLDMSQTTVSFHLRNLRYRLGAANNREIIRKARRHGFL